MAKTLLFILKAIVIVCVGLFVIATPFGHRGLVLSEFILGVCLLFCVGLTMLPRFGWLVPSFMMGIIVGMFMVSPVNTDIDDVIGGMISGGFVGLVIGGNIDFLMKQHRDEWDRISPFQKRTRLRNNFRVEVDSYAMSF